MREIADAGGRITTTLGSIVADIQAGHGTVGKMLKDDTLYAQTRISRAGAENGGEPSRGDRTGEERARGLPQRQRPGEGAGTGSLAETLNYARDAMADLADNTEALEAQFPVPRLLQPARLLRYRRHLRWSGSRAGALESGDRVPLRIWLAREMLFVAIGRDVRR